MSRHIDKAELISKIRELAGLTSDEKSALLELLNEKKTYGLVWENHVEAVEEQLREQLPVLREVPERRILSEDADAPNHIIIEAENLHALVALTYTHAGKIDVIYIDPPYNTGNKDFVYNDSYVDSEDSYRHSKWLSFMEKRLRIAKKLLSDKGVIFISIDDNEQANLKLLCDEVFGEDKFISLFIWKSRQNKDNRNVTGVSIDHEYILCYSKLSGVRALRGADRKTEQYKNPDNDPRGPWASANMAGLLDASQRPNCHYDLINPNTGINYGRPKMGWRYDKRTMNKLIEEKRIIWPDSPAGRPRKKSFLSEISDVLPGYSSVIGETVFTRDGTKELDSLFKKRPFDFPKPIELIKEVLSQTTSYSSTILDFFAGSGTTLHATMQLNAEDGGHRQCILVTNNENGICEQVTYERNKRVIQGYTTPKGEQVAGLTKNNLRYYKADFISREPSSKNKRELVKAATDLLCIKEDLYQEVKTICNGKTLRKDFARRFVESGIANPLQREMLIIYEPAVIKYIVEELKVGGRASQPANTDTVPTLGNVGSYKIKVYVFSDGQYAYNDDFREVTDRVELCALPAAILNAYQRVLPRRKEQPLQQPELTETEIPAEWTEGIVEDES